MRFQIVIATLLFLLTFKAYSMDVYSKKYNIIENVKIVQVVEDSFGNETLKSLDSHHAALLNQTSNLHNAKNTMNNKSGVGEFIYAAREIIAFGKEIYKIIEAGKPVVTLGEVVPLSILPRDEKGEMVDAYRLENWKMPKSQKYRVIATNGFGMETVSFDFMLLFTYGGKYNGKGYYITGAEVAPARIDLAWGYELDASFKVHSIFNQGTTSNPNAAAVLEISYNIKTVLKESRSTKKFMINGKGQTQAY